MENTTPRAITLIRDRHREHAVFNSVNRRLAKARSVADAFASLSESFYDQSIKKQVLDQLSGDRLRAQLQKAQKEYPQDGMLIVVKYVEAMSSGRARYSNVVAFLGSTAPTVQLAMSFFQKSDKMFAAPTVGKIKFDYLWLAPDVNTPRRVYENVLPNDVCIMSETTFRERF